MNRIPHTYSVAALLVGAAVCLTAPAHAQLGGNTRALNSHHKTTVAKPDDPAPPALPGATSLAAPADKTELDLPPTEALFDGINRGDMASVRDALNRGADLNGRNILGMTPIDLSVDLSRNDITFLLLSLRGAPPPLASQTTAETGSGATRTGKPARAPSAARLAMRSASPVPASAPRQYAGPSDPGVPNPQAGFLGFGRSGQ